MTKPVGQTVSAFDSGYDHVFYFTSSGGNQIVKNQITIKNNLTNAVVYQNTVSTLSSSHVVPADTLVNGTQYNYSIITYDANNLASDASDAITFYCYTTPVISFTNIPTDNVIPSSSYTFNISYTQNEGEHINYMVVSLYNSSGDVIDVSDPLYNTGNPPLSFSHTISGFTQATQYMLRVKTVSINGTIVEKTSQTFTANYVEPNIYSKLSLSNDCESGGTNITSNIVLAT